MCLGVPMRKSAGTLLTASEIRGDLEKTSEVFAVGAAQVAENTRRSFRDEDCSLVGCVV